MRGHPSDYDLWAQRGCTGWGWDGLLPYFQKHEAFAEGGEGRGTAGPQPVEHLADVPPVIAPAGRGGAGHRPAGAGRHERAGARGLLDLPADPARPPPDLRRARYLHPAMARPNLTILDEAQVLRIVLERGRAAGIVLRRGGAERVVRARREVILSAGAIGSPQLLMLSGIGPGEQLAALGIEVLRDMPGIGANLQDHYITRMSFRLAGHRWSANRRIAGWRLPLEALRWAARGSGVLTWSPGMFSLFARTAAGLEAPDIQLNGGPLSWAEQPGAGRWPGLRIGVPEAEPGMTIGVWQCRPESRGSVTLASADPAAAPRIAPRYLATEADRACVVRGIRLARRWLSAPPLAGIVLGEARPGPRAETDDELLDFARETGGTVYHPCGTVRMGGDPLAPLDAGLRLRGVEGLRVVDASVFPDIPVCNINATVLSVAEKAADMIREDARRGQGQGEEDLPWTLLYFCELDAAAQRVPDPEK